MASDVHSIGWQRAAMVICRRMCRRPASVTESGTHIGDDTCYEVPEGWKRFRPQSKDANQGGALALVWSGKCKLMRREKRKNGRRGELEESNGSGRGAV